MGTKSLSDISNSAIRIFLQEAAKGYDESRGFPRWNKARDLRVVAEQHFANACCFCGKDFSERERPVEDHLVGINQTDLGLHAWGNVVPACGICNGAKHDKDWRSFLLELNPPGASAKAKAIEAFIAAYRYSPSLPRLRDLAAELYATSGKVCEVLIRSAIDRLNAAGGASPSVPLAASSLREIAARPN